MHGALARAETDVFAFAGSEGKGCAHGGTTRWICLQWTVLLLELSQMVDTGCESKVNWSKGR